MHTAHTGSYTCPRPRVLVLNSHRIHRTLSTVLHCGWLVLDSHWPPVYGTGSSETLTRSLACVSHWSQRDIYAQPRLCMALVAVRHLRADSLCAGLDAIIAASRRNALIADSDNDDDDLEAELDKLAALRSTGAEPTNGVATADGATADGLEGGVEGATQAPRAHDAPEQNGLQHTLQFVVLPVNIPPVPRTVPFLHRTGPYSYIAPAYIAHCPAGLHTPKPCSSI